LTESIQSKLDGYAKKVCKTDIRYPSYYTQEFHAYDEGNLNWPAAYECEQATMSMALRVWPKEQITATEAQDRLRYSYLDAVKNFAKSCSVKSFKTILDVGCSVGLSTFYIADYFPKAKVTGLDLSPQFLAVAQQRQEETDISAAKKIAWKHGFAERTGLTDKSIDLISASFMFHELPQAASTEIIREFFR